MLQQATLFPLLLQLITLLLKTGLICSKSMVINELQFQEDTNIKFHNSYGFWLHLDISRMNYQEQGILTISFPSEIIALKQLKAVYAKTVKAKDQILFEFPIKPRESMFHTDKVFERNSNPTYESAFHIYFNKTINSTEDVKLLIEIMFDRDIDKFSKDYLWISKVALIEEITFPAFYEKMEFTRPITSLIPKYVSFDLKDKYKYRNIFFYCPDNIMTVYYNGLIVDGKINKERLFTQIATSDQYYLSQAGNQHKNFLLKFLTTETGVVTFEVGYMKNPLMIIKQYMYTKIFPIEINKQNQKVFLVGIHNNTRSLFNHEIKYLAIERIYGISSVYKSDTFQPYYLMNLTPDLPQSIEKVNQVSLLHKQVNYIEVQCDSPCRLNLIIFQKLILTEIYTSGQYYMSLSHNSNEQTIRLYNFNDFIIEMTSLKRDFVKVSYENKMIELNQKDNSFTSDSIKVTRDESRFYTFKTEKEAFVKIDIMTKLEYREIPLGLSQFEDETVMFKFRREEDVDYYEIRLTQLNDTPSISYLFQYYGYGSESKISFPSGTSLSFTNQRNLTFSNPYDKIDQVDNKGNDYFYYYFLQAYNDKKFPIKVEFIKMTKTKYPTLPFNTPILFHSENNQGNLMPNFITGKKLVLQYYKCNDALFAFKLSYNRQSLKEIGLCKKRTMFPFNNYYVDYTISTIDIDSFSYSFIFSYSYVDDDAMEYLVANTNHTITYNEVGSSLNIQWHTYMSNKNHLLYKIYINKYNENDTNCTFINDEPYTVLYYAKAINATLMNYTIKNLRQGVYRVNIMAQENSTYHFSQIYDQVVVTVNGQSGTINTMLVFMIVMLGISAIYLRRLHKKLHISLI